MFPCENACPFYNLSCLSQVSPCFSFSPFFLQFSANTVEQHTLCPLSPVDGMKKINKSNKHKPPSPLTLLSSLRCYLSATWSIFPFHLDALTPLLILRGSLLSFQYGFEMSMPSSLTFRSSRLGYREG